ncbi:hypothetical protein [Myxococcus stipitatus]|uniref:hypothetical protein n=1 Tax=Myxococcus stipitatus TaxID=83455 RepID=UPI0030D2CD76
MRTQGQSDGARDFDFLMGTWRVHNRRLKERLKGCTEWISFESSAEEKPLPGGLGNQETYRSEFWPGFVGIALRVYNPATAQWSIAWVDNRSHAIDPPVVGRFSGDVGLFETNDTFEGRSIRVRFTWTRLGQDTARWEQAFSPDNGESWETNWVMDFSRLKE